MTALALLLAAAAATATPSVITQPDWLQKPTGEDVAEHYPPAAMAVGMEGRATLSCRVSATGRLTACEVLEESPKDLGFAQATLAMADSFVMKPMSVNGQPVDGGTVRIPILFRLPHPEVAPPPPPPTTPGMRKAAEQLVDSMGLVEATMRHFDELAHGIETAEEGAASGAARAAVAGAYREAVAAHRADVREAFVRAFAAVFSEDELAATARFQTTYGKLLEGPQVQADQAKLLVNGQRALRAAGHAAFCAKHDCGGAAAVQRVWRPADPKDARIDIPQWDAAPDPSAMAGPELMAVLGVTGVVRMTCRVAAEGALAGCAVDEEAPIGLGFGDAALKLAGQYRLGRVQLDAGAVGRKVTVRVGFPAYPLSPAWQPPQPRSDQALAIGRKMVTDSGVAEATRLQTELEVAGYESKIPPHVDKQVWADAVAAYRAGTAQALTAYGEDTARVWAAAFTEEQLAAIEAFYASPAGKAQRDRQSELNIAAEHASQDLELKITADARRIYCAGRDCTGAMPPPAAAPPQPSAAKPEASTRKP